MTGIELKARREALGLTQQQLASKWESALSTISRWEQLGDEDLPNGGLLNLALEALEKRQILKAKDSRRKT